MVRAASPESLRWIEARTGCVLTRAARGIEAVDSRGVVRGQVAYDNWTENAVQAHMAVDTPVAWRALVKPAFEYPFRQAGKSVIVGFIPAGNARSVHLAKRLGLRETYRVRDGWANGEDVVVLEMRRDECRWLQEAA